MIPEKIIFLALTLNLVGHILYIRSIFLGTTRPNLISWFIWMLAPLIGVFFQLKAGAGLSVLPVFMAGFGPLIIMIAALIKGNAFWKITNFDLIFGAISIFALVLYLFTHNIAVSIIFAILSDGLAGIPTYVKAWKYPESESHHAYSWAILSNIIGVLIIKTGSFTVYSFGIYLILYNIGAIFCIYQKKIFPEKVIA